MHSHLCVADATLGVQIIVLIATPFVAFTAQHILKEWRTPNHILPLLKMCFCFVQKRQQPWESMPEQGMWPRLFDQHPP